MTLKDVRDFVDSSQKIHRMNPTVLTVTSKTFQMLQKEMSKLINNRLLKEKDKLFDDSKDFFKYYGIRIEKAR